MATIQWKPVENALTSLGLTMHKYNKLMKMIRNDYSGRLMDTPDVTLFVAGSGQTESQHHAWHNHTEIYS